MDYFLPFGAVIPKPWIIEENLAEIRFVVPSRHPENLTGEFKELGGYKVLMIKETRQLFCPCPGYTGQYHKCFHLQYLINFVNKGTKTRGVQGTSIDSYHKLELAGRQSAVLATLQTFGPMTNREICESLGWAINQVTGRVKELREQGKVEDAGKVYDKETDRQVHIWRALGGPFHD
jgi:hypothetical protein